MSKEENKNDPLVYLKELYEKGYIEDIAKKLKDDHLLKLFKQLFGEVEEAKKEANETANQIQQIGELLSKFMEENRKERKEFLNVFKELAEKIITQANQKPIAVAAQAEDISELKKYIEELFQKHIKEFRQVSLDTYSRLMGDILPKVIEPYFKELKEIIESEMIDMGYVKEIIHKIDKTLDNLNRNYREMKDDITTIFNNLVYLRDSIFRLSGEIKGYIEDYTQTIENIIKDLLSGMPERLDKVEQNIKKLEETIDGLSKKIENLPEDVKRDIVNNISSSLDNLSKAISSAEQYFRGRAKTEIKGLTKEKTRLIEKLNMLQELSKKIKELTETVEKMQKEIEEVKKLPANIESILKPIIEKAQRESIGKEDYKKLVNLVKQYHEDFKTLNTLLETIVNRLPQVSSFNIEGGKAWKVLNDLFGKGIQSLLRAKNSKEALTESMKLQTRFNENLRNQFISWFGKFWGLLFFAELHKMILLLKEVAERKDFWEDNEIQKYRMDLLKVFKELKPGGKKFVIEDANKFYIGLIKFNTNVQKRLDELRKKR